MLRIMIQENAGQQDENIASVMDAVAAVVVKLTYEALCHSQPGKGGAAATQLKEGVGNPAVLAYFSKHAPGQISKRIIESTLATLKASDQYAHLMQAVIARVEAEHDAERPP
jgi:hypothetical protein